MAACQPDFDRTPARVVDAVQAGGQGRCVVGDDQIAPLEEVDEGGPRPMTEAARLSDDEQLRVGWPSTYTRTPSSLVVVNW